MPLLNNHKAVYSEILDLVGSFKFGQALSLSSEALRMYPDSQALKLQHVRLLMRLGRSSEALVFLNGLPAQSRRGDFIKPYVQLLIEAGRTTEACEYLQEMAQHQRNTPAYQLASVAVCLEQRGLKAAIEVVDGLCSTYQDRQVLWQEALRLRELQLSPLNLLCWLDNVYPFSQSQGAKLARIRALARTGASELAEHQLEMHIIEKGPDPWSTSILIKILREREDYKKCLKICRDALYNHPTHPGLIKQEIDLLLRCGFRDEALEICKKQAALHTGNAKMLLELVRFFIRMGEESHADQVLSEADDLGAAPQSVAYLAAKICLARMDIYAALDILLACRDKAIENPLIERLIAQIKFSVGEISEPSDWLVNRVNVAPGDLESRFVLVRQYVSIGMLEKAEALISVDLPQTAMVTKKKIEFLSDIEFQRGNLNAARELLEPVLDKYPDWLGGLERLTRILLLSGNLQAAWETHVSFTKQRAAADVKGDKTAKTIHSINGQILNEFRIFSTDLDIEQFSDASDPDLVINSLRDKLETNSNSTPLALLLLTNLRRSGHFDTPYIGRDSWEIPRNLFQYWNNPDKPKQVMSNSVRNASLNPDFSYKMFDDISARKYLMEKEEFRAIRAIQLAHHPSGKADIFRLALLWHEGGIYIDADDVCTVPFSRALTLNSRFIGYQEQYMSVGNNFLAVGPRDPFIRAALEDASMAFDASQGESLWLATGPGALTRAFAKHLISPNGQVLDGVQLLTEGKLRQLLVSHTPMKYKVNSHWTARFRHPVRNAST